MPIYEYKCSDCENIFEELVFGEKLPPCPECGSVKTGKLLSRPSLHTGSKSGSGDYGNFGGGSGGGCSGCSGGSCASCGH